MYPDNVKDVVMGMLLGGIAISVVWAFTLHVVLDTVTTALKDAYESRDGDGGGEDA